MNGKKRMIRRILTLLLAFALSFGEFQMAAMSTRAAEAAGIGENGILTDDGGEENLPAGDESLYEENLLTEDESGDWVSETAADCELEDDATRDVSETEDIHETGDDHKTDDEYETDDAAVPADESDACEAEIGDEPGDVPETALNIEPDGAGEQIFASFGIELDTSGSFTEKLADGSYRKRTDSEDKIIPVYTLDEGTEADAASCTVIFSSARGTMNFGYTGSKSSSVYRTTIKDWKEEGVRVFRCGCGPDQIRVSVKRPDINTVEAYDSIEILQEGWESFVGRSGSARTFSGRYYQDGGFLTGWQKFSRQGTEYCYYLQDDYGTAEIYFDPATKTPAEDVYEIEGKKYCFCPAQEAAYQPYVLRKASEDRSLTNLGTGENPYYVCLNKDGSLVTGVVDFGSYALYFAPENGRPVKNTWVHIGDDVYYATSDGGKLVRDGKVTHEGTDYILKAGRLLKGLVTAGHGNRYYCDPVSGAVTYGFITIGKKKYLQTEDGIPQEPGMYYCAALDKSYYTNDKGVVEGGKEVTLPGSTEIFYINPDGTMFMGFKKVGKQTYLYTQTGREIVIEERILDPEDYDVTIGYGYQNSKGELVFYTDESKSSVVKNRIAVLGIDGYPTVIINNKGMISYGFYTIDGKKYYTDKTTGHIMNPHSSLGAIEKADGKLYYFSEDGYVTCPEGNRFAEYNGNKYYIGTNGSPVTGWKTIDGKKYYFGKSGALNTSGQVGKKFYVIVDGDFILTPGKAGLYSGSGGRRYYLNADGSIKTGWATVREGGITKKYYTSPANPPDGVLSVPYCIYRIGKKYYSFDNDGVMRKGWQNGFLGYSNGENCSDILEMGYEGTNYYYYFDKKTGAMVTGTKNIQDAKPITNQKGDFYFSTTFSEGYPLGALIGHGVVKKGSSLLPIDEGQVYTGLPDGLVEAGEEDEFYLVSRGKLLTGLKANGTDRFYFDPATGKMVKDDLKNIKGKWYYFGPDGRMSLSLNATAITSDGTTSLVSVKTHKKGYIEYFYEGDTRISDARIQIAGATYILNSKGAFTKGIYTFKKGPDKGISYLAGSDYKVVSKGLNTVVKYGKKHYLVDNEGKLLKSGHYTAGYTWQEAFSNSQMMQIALTSLSYGTNGRRFYTDSKGAIIKNKIVTSAAGNKVQLNAYGLEAGPFYRKGGKWYCYDESGALSPGKYLVCVRDPIAEREEKAYMTIGNNGRVIGGLRKSNGSVVRGYVDLDGPGRISGIYYLDKKGLPSVGTVLTPKGVMSFNKVSGKSVLSLRM